MLRVAWGALCTALGGLSRLTAVTISSGDAERSWCFLSAASHCVVPSLVNTSSGSFSGLARASHHGAGFQKSFQLRSVLRSSMCHERARLRVTARRRTPDLFHGVYATRIAGIESRNESPCQYYLREAEEEPILPGPLSFFQDSLSLSISHKPLEIFNE